MRTLLLIAAVLTLIAGGDAIAGDQVFTPRPVFWSPPPVQSKPNLACSGTLITTADKNTLDEVVHDFLVIVDFDFDSFANKKIRASMVAHKISVWLMGPTGQYQAFISFMDPFWFSSSTSREKDGSIKQFINGEIDRATGAMYAYETLWSEDGPVSVRHWVLQCKEIRSPLAPPCQPWGPGICLLRVPSERCPKTLPPAYRIREPGLTKLWAAACLSETLR